MLKTIWEYVKKNYNWLYDVFLIAVLIAAIIHMVTCHSTDGAATTAKHIEAVTAAETQKKEVQANAGTVHREQAANDRRIRQRVEQAVDGVPSELTALVDMANAVIRRSQSGK